MRKNKLQLNDSNTEIMIVCSVHNHSKVNIRHIQVGDPACFSGEEHCTERTTLAACPSADFIQGASADLSSTAWECTSVHDRSTFPVPANKITTLQ